MRAWTRMEKAKATATLLILRINLEKSRFSAYTKGTVTN